ncbi:MAG: bacteriohemerythrin [Candidatus Thiodiazotropha sp. (ex Lucinoma borealis)]|nr:bacteriohemerythrin [Candidatus Thiodiazotropha sp. (ex Lucinoma borealis)]MCU7868785.1 bacteriohemerythrin [Candidatus Thiodiazotropha sp. (ex Lucinoma borealis)]
MAAVKTDNSIESFEIFPWDNNFETGIALIDEQHQKLVQILNRLAVHLANRSSKIILNEVFDELFDYADYHFKAEEEVWRKHLLNDESLNSHEKTHQSFISKVTELRGREVCEDDDQVMQDTVGFLTHWLAYHILDNDKRMAKVIIAIESGKTVTQAKLSAHEEMSGSMQLLIETVLKMYDSLSLRTMDLMREKTLRKQAEQALLENEEKWRFVFESNHEEVWDWDIQKSHETHQSVDNILVYIIDHELVQDTHASRIHPDDIAQVKHHLQLHLDDKTPFFTSKHRLKHTDGSWTWVLSRGKVVSRNEQGLALRMVGTHSDISERELASIIFRSSNQGMMISDRDNRIISVNPAFTEITGYSPAEVIGKDPKFLASERNSKELYRKMWDELQESGHSQAELWNRNREGKEFFSYLRINTALDDQNQIDHYIGLLSDITEKKRNEDLVLRHANYDVLTNLPNRRMFFSLLDNEIKRSRRRQVQFGLLFIDLDHFKEVNDTLSHEIGDRLLIDAASRMHHCIRESDAITRIGGDEFAVIIGELKYTSSLDSIAKNIIDALSVPFKIDVNQIYISASIGITIFPDDGEDATSLLKNADQAMYRAKKSGRSRYSYFTSAMQIASVKRQLLLGDLRVALARNQFELYYQPIIDLSNGTVCKAEALLRWNHPERGTTLPGEFISLAEESGLIVDIGNWVFDEAIRQLVEWSGKTCEGFQISVNKSPLQFRDKDAHQQWLQKLQKSPLHGRNVVVEITENLLMENETSVHDQLLEFRDYNIEVALDDFGTGYSSLSYLKDFHIDYIKIDQSFVRNLKEESQEMVLCEAMIVMAHKLGIKIIAEGVETQNQMQLLKQSGCDYAQGFFYSKPIRAGEFESFLSDAED